MKLIQFKPISLVIFTILVLTAVTLIWISCEKQPESVMAPIQGPKTSSLAKVTLDIEKVMAIQDKYTDVLLELEGVIGTGTTALSDASYAIKILTRVDGLEKVLPTSLDEVPVVVENVGEIRALTLSGRYRPVTQGVSGGNINDRKFGGLACSSGTIGCVVTKSDKFYFLSNNHVFARENKAKTGEDIVQPGLVDVNCAQITNDIVADLSQFKTITFSTSANNTIDAAIAEIRASVPYSCATECGFTPSTTPVTATLNMNVKKCGRTTELTTGTVTALNVTVVVQYSRGKARFVNQIQFSDISDGGDSGSLIVTSSGNNPVALLFAGSDVSTIGNPIQDVLSYFGVTVCGQ